MCIESVWMPFMVFERVCYHINFPKYGDLINEELVCMLYSINSEGFGEFLSCSIHLSNHHSSIFEFLLFCSKEILAKEVFIIEN